MSLLEQRKRPVAPELPRVTLRDDFYAPFMRNVETVAARDIIAKFEADGALQNYRRVAAHEEGGHSGPPWFHGLVCECIRGISDLLVFHYDAELDATLDRWIAEITAAIDASEDDYLNPHTTLMQPLTRFGRNGGNVLGSHETYNPGCLAEAAVHHYLATGKTSLLAVAVRNWNYYATEIGEAPRHNVTAEHSIAEEALIKLAGVFERDPALSEKLGAKPEEYRRMAKFLIDTKGHNEDRYSFPQYLDEYSQDHRPAREQRNAVGHAVRATLFYTGMATVADRFEDEELAVASRAIWRDVTTSKLHANGCVGAIRAYERFGSQYDLTNRAYLETCAGIGFAFWGFRLHHLYPEAAIYDEIETTLANVVPASVSEDFTLYTYENPLTVAGNYNRWKWHKCPCCPPMLLKITGMLPQFVYAESEDGLYVNLYADSTLTRSDCTVTQDGKKFRFQPAAGRGSVTLTIRARMPRYARDFSVTRGGAPLAYRAEDGYAVFTATFAEGEGFEVSFREPIVKYEAHPFVSADRGRVMVKKGATLYCAESIDNPFVVNEKKEMELTLRADAPIVRGEGDRLLTTDTEGHTVTLIPYRRWNNRELDGSMIVWMREENLPFDPVHITRWEGNLYLPYREYEG